MPKRILLADDSITIQKVVELTFSDGDYEVTAVNNGTKAIQKLAEMRPDIILSDIIMPEKNGYEVCEYVKSHPEFRTIPVVLLTGTFEPFDPDRADKAGCDAVVTKPFESQSLIHKVEELIEHSKSQGGGASAAAPAAEAPPPAAAPAPPAEQESPFATSSFQAQSSDIFGAPAASTNPFEDMGAASGETKAIPRMSFDELQKMANEPAAAPPPPPAAPAAPEASPWDEPSPMSGETKAFTKMSFDDLQKQAGGAPPPPAAAAPPPPPAAPEPSPWDEPAATSGETKAIPKMSFEDLKKAAVPAPPEPAPWEAPAPPPPAPEPASPWDEPAATGGETRTIPKMSFDDLQKSAAPEVGGGAPAPSPAFSAPSPTPPPAAEGGGAPLGGGPVGELTDEQIDRIARRVVELISKEVVKNIAWEVIPDMAEMVVKERIRQLESEA